MNEDSDPQLRQAIEASLNLQKQHLKIDQGYYFQALVYNNQILKKEKLISVSENKKQLNFTEYPVLLYTSFDPQLTIDQNIEQFGALTVQNFELLFFQQAHPEDVVYYRVFAEKALGCSHLPTQGSLLCETCGKFTNCAYCHEDTCEGFVFGGRVKCMYCQYEGDFQSQINCCNCDQKMFDNFCTICGNTALNVPFSHSVALNKCVMDGADVEAEPCLLCQGTTDCLVAPRMHMSCDERHVYCRPCVYSAMAVGSWGCAVCVYDNKRLSYTKPMLAVERNRALLNYLTQIPKKNEISLFECGSCQVSYYGISGIKQICKHCLSIVSQQEVQKQLKEDIIQLYQENNYLLMEPTRAVVLKIVVAKFIQQLSDDLTRIQTSKNSPRSIAEIFELRLKIGKEAWDCPQNICVLNFMYARSQDFSTLKAFYEQFQRLLDYVNFILQEKIKNDLL